MGQQPEPTANITTATEAKANSRWFSRECSSQWEPRASNWRPDRPSTAAEVAAFTGGSLRRGWSRSRSSCPLGQNRAKEQTVGNGQLKEASAKFAVTAADLKAAVEAVLLTGVAEVIVGRIGFGICPFNTN